MQIFARSTMAASLIFEKATFEDVGYGRNAAWVSAVGPSVRQSPDADPSEATCANDSHLNPF
ncbi:MAG: hypothetical protein ACK4ZE_12855 [Sphingorhabdus sp.]